MYRTHNCGELNIKNVNENITLSGWVHSIRNLGSMIFIDLRDRYGITQLAVDITTNQKLFKKIKQINREFVITISGLVKERTNKNLQNKIIN